jgi:dTDP-4-dehydrorhamnose reductase
VGVTAKILVLGRSGQVARELGKLGAPDGYELAFAGRERFDLLGGADPRPLIDEIGPSAVINAAAYTAVDKAESEPEAAFRLNRDAPAALARACAEAGLPFVHFSTDYVFDGSKTEPYVETDPVSPTGVYGSSKAAGEEAVLAAGGRAVVLRTSWVYSAFGANFLKTMLRIAGTREEIGVVDDQFGRPTWAEDCARGAFRAVQALEAGEMAGPQVLHLAGADDATWADFAEAIFERSAVHGGPVARVKRITTAEYPTAARRPANSRLDCSKMTNALNWPMRPWRQSLAACFDELETAAT